MRARNTILGRQHSVSRPWRKEAVGEISMVDCGGSEVERVGDESAGSAHCRLPYTDRPGT